MLTDILDEGVDFGEEKPHFLTSFFATHKVPLVIAGIGVLFVILGVVFSTDVFTSSDEIQILGDTTQSDSSVFVVEIAGAVVSPGVFEITSDTRVADVITLAGGLADDADSVWTSKYLNKAARVTDGQKIYIPSVDEQSGVGSASDVSGDQTISSGESSVSEGYTNINTASLADLEKLWGIGRVTGEKIIEHRPYSTVEELLTKKILKSNVYERNKDILTVY